MYIYIYIYMYMYVYVYIYIYTYTTISIYLSISLSLYIYIYIYLLFDNTSAAPRPSGQPPPQAWSAVQDVILVEGCPFTVDFRNFIVLVWGRDPGTLKSDIVSKKHPQLICSELRLSN